MELEREKRPKEREGLRDVKRERGEGRWEQEGGSKR